MADPTTPDPNITPITEDSINNMLKLTMATEDASSGMEHLSKSMGIAETLFGKLSNRLSDAGIGLSSVSDLTGTAASKFGLLATAMIGTQDTFKSFGNVDTTRLTTFTSQVDQLFEVLKRPGTAVGVLNNTIDTIVNTLSKVSPTAGGIANGLRNSLGALQAYAKQVLTAADNQLRLQNSMLQLATQSGSLSEFYKQIGGDMTHLNEVSARQTKVLTDASKATGIDIEVLSNYAGTLSEIPGAFMAMKDGIIDATGTTNIFTKTLMFSIGAGRDFKAISSDMKKAVSEYGLSMDSALKFVARMTETSTAMGAQIDDVRSALNTSADAFKMFVVGGQGAINITQGMSDVMTEYVGTLKNAGMPVQNAIQMFGTMSSAMSNMKVEQKAFLSAQTGGPGGLMGAFQIDKMLKDGDIKGVFDKVQTQLKKQLGNIITVDEASKSPQAALQMERQIMLLRQGPLGQFAKTDQEAERLLEAMKSGKTPEKLGGQSNLSLENVIKAGNSIQEKSYNEFTKMNVALREISMAAGTPVLGELQRRGTISSGAPGGDISAEVSNNRAKLSDFRTSGVTASKSENTGQAAITDLHNVISNVAGAGAAFISGAKESINNRNDSSSNNLQNIVAAQREANRVNESSGGQVGAAATSSQQLQRKQQTVAIDRNVQQNGPVPVVLSGNTALTVNMTSNCPHCGNRYSSSEHARLSPASVAKPGY